MYVGLSNSILSIIASLAPRHHLCYMKLIMQVKIKNKRNQIVEYRKLFSIILYDINNSIIGVFCLDTHLHTHTHTHTHTCTYTYIHARTRAYLNTHSNTNTFSHTRTHARVRTYTHARMHTYTHSLTRTHTHALTHTDRLFLHKFKYCDLLDVYIVFNSYIIAAVNYSF